MRRLHKCYGLCLHRIAIFIERMRIYSFLRVFEGLRGSTVLVAAGDAGASQTGTGIISRS